MRTIENDVVYVSCDHSQYDTWVSRYGDLCCSGCNKLLQAEYTLHREGVFDCDHIISDGVEVCTR